MESVICTRIMNELFANESKTSCLHANNNQATVKYSKSETFRKRFSR